MNFNNNGSNREDISNLSTEEIANKIFCDDIKPPRSIQLIYPDANVKEIFQQLMVIFTIGMKIYHGDNYGNVDLTQISEKQFKRIIDYFASFGIRLICEIRKNSINEEYIKHIDESNDLPPLDNNNISNNNSQNNGDNLNDYFLTLKTDYLIYKISFDFL